MSSIRPIIQTSLSPEACVTSGEKGTSEKMSGIFSGVAKLLKQIHLNLQCSHIKLEGALGFVKRHSLFKGKCVAKTTNCGKGEDIGKYLQPVAPENLEGTAEKRGFQVDNDPFLLDPFSKGVCYGASIWFSRRYLETGDLNTVAQEFKGGVPYEAVLLQGCYEQIGRAPFESVLGKISIDFRKNLEEKCATEEEKYTFLTDEKIFNAHLREFGLEDKPEAKARLALTVATCLDAKKHSPPSFIQTIIDSREFVVMAQRCNESIQKHAAAQETMKDFSGLGGSTVLFDEYSSPYEILDSIPSWQTGVYELSLPVYNILGTQIGSHAVTFVKESNRSYLFDPNYGLGYEDTNGQELVRRLFSVYCGELPSLDSRPSFPKQIYSLIKRVRDIYLMRPHFPRSIIHHNFTVTQMKLSP